MAVSRNTIAQSLLSVDLKTLLAKLLGVGTVAAAGSAQSDATPLLDGKNVVTAANDAKGVRLPSAEPDGEVVVINTVSNKILLVYPATGEQINAVAVNGAFSVAAGVSARFLCDATGHWYVATAADISGVTSSAAELNILTGVTATTAELNMAADNSANNEIVTATNVITAAESGSTYFLNSATEFVSTLPAPALGLKYTFIVSAAPSGASYTVVTNASGNVIKGLQLSAAGDAGDTGTADDTITFVDGQAVAGDRVDVHSDGTSWFAYARSKVAAGITFTQAS